MKKLLILPLVILAAGCGSTTTKTVTSPPKTVTVTKVDKTVSLAQQACPMAMEMLIKMESKTIAADQASLKMQYTKSTTLINQVNAKIKVLKPLVNLCRSAG